MHLLEQLHETVLAGLGLLGTVSSVAVIYMNNIQKASEPRKHTDTLPIHTDTCRAAILESS